MAYFSNGSEGMAFDEECSTCPIGQEPCPIFLVQIEYNYEACNNEVARSILEKLVADNGTCSMKQLLKRKAEK